MQPRAIVRIVASCSAAFMLAGAMLVACQDTPTTTGSVKPANDARVTQRASVSPSAIRAREHIHARNPQDWVGVAHNDAIDAFREDLRKGGKPAKLCEHLAGFLLREKRLAAAHRPSPSEARKGVFGALQSTSLCKNKLPDGALVRSAVLSTAPRPYRVTSPQSEQMLFDIEAAIANAADSYDLAGRLSVLLDAAASLESSERDIVAATISVAQNSFEYWEVQQEPYILEFEQLYGACAVEQFSAGYDTYQARDYCMNGTQLLNRDSAPAGRLVVMHAYHPLAPQTMGERLATGLRSIAFGDARGAFTAGFTTLISTLSVQTAVGNAILGGAANSIAIGAGLAWQELARMKK